MISCKGSRTAAAAGIPARAPALAPPSLGSLTVFTLLCLGCIWGQETTVHDILGEGSRRILRRDWGAAEE
jgi:hypothetical protein